MPPSGTTRGKHPGTGTEIRRVSLITAFYQATSQEYETLSGGDEEMRSTYEIRKSLDLVVV